MGVTVVGSIAFDAVETPFGVRERMLGGAATHFALAASLFERVHIVGPVGDDFGDEEMAVLATRGSVIDDVEREYLSSLKGWTTKRLSRRERGFPQHFHIGGNCAGADFLDESLGQNTSARGAARKSP